MEEKQRVFDIFKKKFKRGFSFDSKQIDVEGTSEKTDELVVDEKQIESRNNSLNPTRSTVSAQISLLTTPRKDTTIPTRITLGSKRATPRRDYFRTVEGAAATPSNEETPSYSPPLRGDDRVVKMQNVLKELNVARKIPQHKIYLSPIEVTDINIVITVQNEIRRYYARHSPEMKKLKQRKNVVKEIMDTEKTYVERLELFKDLYLSKALEVIPDDVVMRQCKDNLIVILGYNGMMLERLQELVSKGFVYGNHIGEVFSKLTYFLKSYCVYVNCIDCVNKREEQLMKMNKRFENEMKNVKKEHSLDSFNSYVILPIQRIPRYKLLLEELIKTMPDNHPELQSLKESLGKIKEVGNTLNAANVMIENRGRVMYLLSHFKYNKESDIIEDKTSHQLKAFKVIEVVNEKTAEVKRIYCFVFNEFLVFTKCLKLTKPKKKKEDEDTLETVIESNKVLNVIDVLYFGKFVFFNHDQIVGKGALEFVTSDQQVGNLVFTSEDDKIDFVKCIESECISFMSDWV
ncbi:Rho/RAC guanine nucleotide exchange factor, putative, partial [Entamoeba invadens IP1]